MVVGITGQQGFIGYHLTQYLNYHHKDCTVLPFSDDYFDNQQNLDDYIGQCDVIVHLAGVNRNPDQNFIYLQNIELTNKLIKALEKSKKKPHILFSSSSQETIDNPYGKAKKEARLKLETWATNNNCRFNGLVIPNVFGPFGKPFYNSFIATFCFQLTHGQIPEIKTDSSISLIYVGNLVEYITNLIFKNKTSDIKILVPSDITVKVSEVLGLLKKYKKLYLENSVIPQLSNNFETDLFNTFRSFIEPTGWLTSLKPNIDNRGVLYEVIKMNTGGQLFYSTTKPGITRGNHFHFRKIERFCVIAGKGLIKLRKINTPETNEFHIDGSIPGFIDIPVLYTHNITNVGNNELVTLFWSNEIFNHEKPDTFFEEV